MPAPTPVANGSSTATGDSAATSANWPTPSGYADGDVAVVDLTANGTSTITPPDGWALVRSGTNGTRLLRYVKKLTGAQPASHVFAFSTGTKHIIAGQLYRGADAAVDASAVATGSTQLIPMTSVTTTGPDRLVVSGVAVADANPFVHPSGTAERWDLPNAVGVGDIASGGADFVQASAGATPSTNWDQGAADAWIAITVALKPAGSQEPAPYFVGLYGI